jgi:hypothetical protein
MTVQELITLLEQQDMTRIVFVRRGDDYEQLEPEEIESVTLTKSSRDNYTKVREDALIRAVIVG